MPAQLQNGFVYLESAEVLLDFVTQLDGQSAKVISFRIVRQYRVEL